MKAFYSILYAMINAYTGDKVSVGLLMIGEDEVYFNYSKQKLSIIKKLYPGSASSLLTDSLKNIESTVKTHNKISDANEIGLHFDKSSSHVFTQQYIDYLSVYGQNLLTFSSPNYLEVKPSDDIFEKLFQKFVGYTPEKLREPTTHNLYRQMKKSLYPKIDKRVLIDKQITHNEVQDLPYTVKINFIGQNDFPVAGKVIDLNQHIETNKTHFTEFTLLMKALESKHNRGKYFLISEEPQKNSKNHDLWKQIRKVGFFEYVDASETQIIEDYLEHHDVRPEFC